MGRSGSRPLPVKIASMPKAAAMGIMLRKIDKNYKENPDIKWNFTKFLVDRQGTVVVRFEPTGDMRKLEEQILTLL